jgi:hypothetical protein
MRRGIVVGLLGALALAASASAGPKSAFTLKTSKGKTVSYSWTGYEFSSGLKPKLNKSGTLTVDVKIKSKTEKSALKKGALDAASLHVVATLPKKINTTYKLSKPKITEVTFADGNFGPAAAVVLSYKKLST